MVNPDTPAAEWVNDAEIPPVPPRGGYRGATRLPAASVHPPGAPPVQTAPPVTPTAGGGALGWIALAVASVFGVIVLIMLGVASPAALTGPVMLAAQLAVIGTVIAAWARPRSRRLGAIATSIVLVLNIGTVGALAATLAPAGEVHRQGAEKSIWVDYPGMKDVSEYEILSQPSLEEATRSTQAVIAELRAELTAELGYDWVHTGTDDRRAERNGYGGESMLVTVTTSPWSTTRPITSIAEKERAVAVMTSVVRDNGIVVSGLLNDPENTPDSDLRETFYGSAEMNDQTVWEFVAIDDDTVTSIYAVIVDLSRDSTGQFRSAREGQTAGTDEPLQGLRIFAWIGPALSEADRDAFVEELSAYP